MDFTLVEIRRDVLLKDWTWWKIGGPADYFCLPASVAELRDAKAFARAQGLPLTVLGGGTNVLVHDAGVAGLVVCMKNLAGSTATIEEGRLVVKAKAGTKKSDLTRIFLKHKLAPALFLCGLPGDVGGGVVMNAGVAENITPREFHELVDWVEVFDWTTDSLKRFSRSEVQWTYRHSAGWQPGVIVEVGLSWPLEETPDLAVAVREATRTRLRKQPLELPSCGSTFKNPPGTSAGTLIDQAGLKGYTVGGAQVSPKHANFIVNIGSATAENVQHVIAHVRAVVEAKYQIQLETEVRYLGRWPT